MSVQIKSEVNGAGGAASVFPGEIRQFAYGQMPEGWTAISGPAEVKNQPAFGTLTIAGIAAKLGVTEWGQWPVATAKGRLFISMQGSKLYEANGDFTAVRTPASIPSLNTAYFTLLVPMDDGHLLRIGGNTSDPSSGITQRYNVDTRFFNNLATKPTATVQGMYAKACQAGDGNVYGLFAQSGTGVDMFNPTLNQWTENVAVGPATASNCVAITRLPSGNLMFTTTTAQYVFNVATKTFTQVNSLTTVKACVATAVGVRMYVLTHPILTYVVGIAFYDYNESTGLFTLTETGIPCPINTGATAPGYAAVKNPYTGAIIVKSLAVQGYGDTAMLHHQPYQPIGVVSAAKN